MKKWILLSNNMNDSQTAAEHLIGVFNTIDEVKTEIEAQCKHEGGEITEFDIGPFDNLIYAECEHEGELYVTFEAELRESKWGRDSLGPLNFKKNIMKIYVVSGEGPEFMDKHNWLTHTLIYSCDNFEEAHLAVLEYSGKVMRSNFGLTEKSTSSENNVIWIYEDDYGEDKIIITEVK